MNNDCSQKTINFRGIRFKTWIYFFSMTVIILIILLFMQIFLLNRYYRNLKENDVERVGESISEAYANRQGNIQFREYVQQTQYTSDVDILFFYLQEPQNNDTDRIAAYNLFSLPQYGGLQIGIEDDALAPDSNFLHKLENTNQATYTIITPEDSWVVYSAKFEDSRDGTVYLQLSANLYINDFTVFVIRRQSIIASMLCAGLSVLLSWFVSYNIARPITQFSKVAKRLAKGDYSVRFDSNGLSEIEDLAQTLNYATEEMGKTEALRRDLLANVSHDLRTPLTMVKAYAEMIRDLSGADPQKRIKHSQTIIDEADRLTNLVNDIQNLSKLQSGTEHLEAGIVNLSELTCHVLERFKIYSKTDGYVFKMEITPDLEIKADEAKIEQVLYNLIGNAINYTGEDKTISVYVRKKTDKAYFGVRDSGKGIAQEEINTVWERYYRSSQSKRTRVGTGLGLSIVKNILIMHGAESGIISELGKGSTFWFSMPLYDASMPDTEESGKVKKVKMLKM